MGGGGLENSNQFGVMCDDFFTEIEGKMSAEAAILTMKDVRKSFDANLALDDVSFELKKGEIHGLLGGNGAGKTTLMNVLFGLYRQDAGEIILNGENVAIHSPKDAINLGVGMVHQHFLQINNYTIIENIVLGTPVKNQLTMNLTEEERVIKELCERFEIDVDMDATIEDLPMGTRQKVEILKAIYRGAKVLILDEPTTNLTPQEVDALFVTLRTMVNEGLSIVFITHKLREVLSVCDRISVLREGKNVITLERDEASEEAFVRAMVGENLDVGKSVIFSKAGLDSGDDAANNDVVLDAKGLQVISGEKIEVLKKASFQIHEGEIFGIAGVAGNGQRELVESVMGIIPLSSGELDFDSIPCGEIVTSEMLKRGVAYIPEDRLEDGYLPKANVAQNLILGMHKQQPFSNRGFINWKTVFSESWKMIKEYNIKTAGPDEVAGNLSGGNIQRVMIARAFSQPIKLMIAHNPTRGLDIASMDFVYKKILERKQQNGATFLISEDLDELLLISDRLAVMYKGEIVGILNRDKFEKYEIGRMMSGVTTNQ
jgi:general nucleoside transport system ATP-binding protein